MQKKNLGPVDRIRELCVELPAAVTFLDTSGSCADAKSHGRGFCARDGNG